MSNLRKVLDPLHSIDILYQSDKWYLKISDTVTCDYFEFLKLIEANHIDNAPAFNSIFNIIREGEIFKGESHPWLDDVKGYVGNIIIDILLQYLQDHIQRIPADEVLKITDVVFIYDPLNDMALSYKMKTLIKQNNHHLAKYTFKRFCQLYEELYGEHFTRTFRQMTSS